MMLNERIRDLRKSKGYSQEQMARKLHITQGAISQWENGLTVPAADQLVTLAAIFEISVDELLGCDAQKEAPASGLDDRLVDMLVSLSPDQVQRVMDFVAGMKAADKA